MKWLQAELRRRYERALRLPMSWRMIDAIVTLEEADERKSRPSVGEPPQSAESNPDKPRKA